MKKRQYKVRIENGEIKFYEPLDLSGVKEGIIIFLEEEKQNPDNLSSLLAMAGSISVEPTYKELTSEFIDSIVYDEP